MGRSVLTEAKYKKVKKYLAKNLTLTEAATLTGVSVPTVSRVKRTIDFAAYKELVNMRHATKPTVEKNEPSIVGYKAFDPDWKCRDMQYEVGATFEAAGTPKLCGNGLHFCENPLDIFGYYPPTSKFAEVEATGVSEETSDDSKRVAKRLYIKAELNLHSLVDAGVKFILSKVDFENAKESNTGGHSAATNTGYQSAATNTGYQSAATNTGDRSAATNTGDRSAATNTGYQSAATNTGDRSAATNTGNRSAATNTGYQSAATNTGYQSAATNTGYQSAATNTGYQSAATNTGNRSAATNTGDHSAATNTGNRSAATNTGYQSAATNTGDRSAATNTGDRSAATNTGNRSAATNTGDYSAATIEGKDGVAIVTGVEGRASGKKGCWIVLTERYDYTKSYAIKEVKAFEVDGKNIKEDTFYTLQNGEAVEV